MAGPPKVHPAAVVHSLMRAALRGAPAILDELRAVAGANETDKETGRRIQPLPFKTGVTYPAIGFAFLDGHGITVLGEVEVMTTTRWSLFSVMPTEDIGPLVRIDAEVTEVMTRGLGWPTKKNDYGIVFSCCKGDPRAFAEIRKGEEGVRYEHLGFEWVITARGADDAGQV